MYKSPSVLIAVSLMLNFGVLAHEAVSGGGLASKAALNDDQAVQLVLKRQFDKPGAPLKVAPVSIEGGYAVAGWLQEQRGGRALLKKVKNEWSIQVCGGDGLKQASTLVMTGMSKAIAEKLSQKVMASEKLLPAEDLKRFAMFEGMIKVNAGSHASHGAAHTNAPQPK